MCEINNIFELWLLFTIAYGWVSIFRCYHFKIYTDFVICCRIHDNLNTITSLCWCKVLLGSKTESNLYFLILTPIAHHDYVYPQSYSLVSLSNIARRELRALLSGLLLVESRVTQARMLQLMLLSESLICTPSLLGMVGSSQTPYVQTLSYCYHILLVMLYTDSNFELFFGFITITSSPFIREAGGLLLYLFAPNLSCSSNLNFLNSESLLLCRLLKFTIFHKMICWQKTQWYLIHTPRFLFGWVSVWIQKRNRKHLTLARYNIKC